MRERRSSTIHAVPHLASIVHVPDLHLFVHPDGRTRDPRDRRFVERVAIAVLGTVFHGLGTADDKAVDQLVRFLPRVIEVERRQGGAVVVVQTGDVEAFGHLSPGGLAGFQYLHDVVWPQLEQPGVTVIDVYGNHDIWPGHPPLPGEVHDARYLSALPRIGADWTLPIEVAAPGAILRFHRLNTVIINRLRGGLTARGGVGPHPPSDVLRRSDTEAVLRRIGDAARAGAESTLNIVLCHHPPHLFKAGLGTRYTTGYLAGAGTFAGLTPDRVALVIAGHRHALDPPAGARLDASGGHQPPLRPGSGQLVAESPTQRDGNPNSLSVYRLGLEDDGNITVDRLRFGFTPATGLRRLPARDDRVLAGLRPGRVRS